MAKKSRAKKNVLKVDFTNVEPGGKVPEGDYPVRVREVTVEESSSGNPYLKWVFEIIDGRYKGRILYHNTSLQPQALFNLRNTLEALGMEVPQAVVELDLDNLVGLKAAVSVEIEVYQGKEKSRVVEVFPLEDLVEDEDDEDGEDEDYEDGDDEDDEDEDDEDEDDEDEDDEDDEIENEDEPDEDGYDDDEGDEGDEEGEEVEVYTKEELEEMDDDELLEVAEEFDVKPEYKRKGKRKKLDRAKTIEAILEASKEE